LSIEFGDDTPLPQVAFQVCLRSRGMKRSRESLGHEARVMASSVAKQRDTPRHPPD
jgi:hypothetical protein